MAYEHKPLTVAELGSAATKITDADAPPKLREMAARGLAPVPPRDLLVVLYQFWVVGGDPLAEEAAKTVVNLPASVLAGAVGDAGLPPGVLDFLSRKLATNEDVLERIVRHPRVHDQTLASIARVCPERLCDSLAENQQRWLAFPAIVEALYQNPNCRMSIAHQMLELAIRQGIEMKLPNIDEIKAALGDGVPVEPGRDRVFRSATGHQVADDHARLIEALQRSSAAEQLHDDASPVAPMAEEDLDVEALMVQGPEEDLSLPLAESEAAEDGSEIVQDQPGGDRMTLISKLKPMEKIRLALLGSAFERSVLIRDANKSVALSAIKSPRVKESEVVAYSATRTLHHEVIRHIARRRDWSKLYAVKLNLVLNPKCPMATAMTFLGHLHAHDVRKVAHSRSIPSALAQAAKRKMNQRR